MVLNPLPTLSESQFHAVNGIIKAAAVIVLGVVGLVKPQDAVKTLGLPVLVRPSYVLGGQNMNIAFEENDVYAFMQHILEDGIRKWSWHLCGATPIAWPGQRRCPHI